MYPFFRSFRFSFLLSCIGVETNVSVKREKKMGAKPKKEAQRLIAIITASDSLL